MDENWTIDLSGPDPTGRLLAGAGALIPLYGFWDLVLHHWPAALAPGGLPLLALGLVALALGLLLLSAAVVGTPQSLTVDRAAGRVIVTARVPGLGPVRRRIPFARIATVTVAGDDESDAPHPLRLCLIQRGPRWPVCLTTRPTARRAEIEALAARLRASVQAPLSSGSADRRM